MKKFFTLAVLALLFVSIANQTAAQSPTPRVGSEWTKTVWTAQNIHSEIGTRTIEFYPDQNVYKIQVQVDYSGVTGDSCQIKIYPSSNNNSFSSTPVNTLANLRWKSGAGTSVTKFDAIDVSGYPVNFLKIVTDTCTGMTAGTVRVTIKPYFK